MFCLLLFVAIFAIPFAVAQRNATNSTILALFHTDAPTKITHRTLTFAERVAYQRAVEEVYWRHRIWPKERPDSKLPFDGVMSHTRLEKKVAGYLRDSHALEDYWQQPITAQQLQAEMDRMAQHTRQPDVLRELFDALGNDPFVIAECLARPVLSARLVASLDAMQTKVGVLRPKVMAPASANYILPKISEGAGGCTDNTWTATTITNAPAHRELHTAVWTGIEMIVWGGNSIIAWLNTGGRYNPSTDFWTATTTTNAPSPRNSHTAVWTGSEMIVWGGSMGITFNTGGRYDPGTDSWTATNTTNAPSARALHTAIWTGSEMIVWGGTDGNANYFNTGGRYNPSTNSWTPTSTSNAPSARDSHTAVWTGSEMIVWGGTQGIGTNLNTGGRYNPSTNSWTPTTTTNAPQGRFSHTAVWTSSQMIAWGGTDGNANYFNTGGRYSPSTNSWTATSTTNAPDGRVDHTAAWTGREMIIWGGDNGGFLPFDTGGDTTLGQILG